MQYTYLKKQKGIALALILSGIASLSVITYLGSSVYLTIFGGIQKTNLVVQSSHILTQSAYTLSTEFTKNSYGIPLATNFLLNSFSPIGGGIIPSNSAAGKVDSYGSYIGYCIGNATKQGDPVFAVISAGPNKMFNTTCTQALLGSFSGDDKVIIRSVANILQGVGGTVYFGDPVPSSSDLGNLTISKLGEIRVVLNNGSIWVNKTGDIGMSYWNQITSNNSSATTLSIKNVGDTCIATSTGLNPNIVANEGIAITNDRLSLLSCQNGVWSKTTSKIIEPITGYPIDTCETHDNYSISFKRIDGIVYSKIYQPSSGADSGWLQPPFLTSLLGRGVQQVAGNIYKTTNALGYIYCYAYVS